MARPLALAFSVLGSSLCLATCSAPGRAVPNAPAASDKAAAVSAAPAPWVLAEAECPSPKVRIQVTEVTRSGPESIIVKLRFLNLDRTAPVVIGGAFADAPQDAGSLSGVFVLDAAEQKRVSVLRDDRGQPQCSTGLGAVPPGGQVEAWARYPVPVAGATRVTVQFPGVPAFRDLAVADQPRGTGAAGPSY